MSVPGQETDEVIEIKGLRRCLAAPILKRVPCLRPVQDENVTLSVSKIVGVLGGYERPIDPRRGLRCGLWLHARREK
jgi:hypothetical protein